MIKYLNQFHFLLLIFSISAYQLFYVFVTLTRKPPVREAKKNHRYAVVISARNENAVIGDLIHSIRVQNYPQELIDIFVIADNCTDNTAAVAQEAGAIVFPRFNTEEIGKGYALDYGITCIREHYSQNKYEAYFVFDADNVLDVKYLMVALLLLRVIAIPKTMVLTGLRQVMQFGLCVRRNISVKLVSH